MKTMSLKYLKVQKNFTCHLFGHKKQTQLQNQIKVEIHLGILFRIYELSKKKAKSTNFDDNLRPPQRFFGTFFKYFS